MQRSSGRECLVHDDVKRELGEPRMQGEWALGAPRGFPREAQVAPEGLWIARRLIFGAWACPKYLSKLRY